MSEGQVLERVVEDVAVSMFAQLGISVRSGAALDEVGERHGRDTVILAGRLGERSRG